MGVLNMAAIDKIYVDNFEQYLLFKEWLEKQPNIIDKYGVEVSMTRSLYKYDTPFEGCHPVFMGSYYEDAYLIKNCPFDFIQKELMLNYGHWSQDKINEAYEEVKKRVNGVETPFYTWLEIEDFEIVFFSKHSDMSIAESFYYCLRNSLAHGAFEIKESKHGKIYLFENRKEGKIKARMRIKEKTMLDLVEI